MKYYSDEILEFAKTLEEREYPKTVIAGARRFIKEFGARYNDEYTLVNILKYDFKHAGDMGNPALVLYWYKRWTEEGIAPPWCTRQRGIKDGYSRPASCAMQDCRYNSGRRCRYQPYKELPEPLYWKRCKYYDQVHEARDEDHIPPQAVSDGIYAHIADYKDSHSARWIR